MANPSKEGVIIVCGVDIGHRDLTTLLVALERAGKLEVVECIEAPPAVRQDELAELFSKCRLPEPVQPEIPRTQVPYYRRFERKRRAR